MPRNSIDRFGEVSRWNAAGAGIILLSALLLTAATEKPSSTTIKDFSVPMYHDPPHEKQMKSLLQGAEAEPQPGGFILITDARLQLFTESGQPQVLVLAPHCVFDAVQHTISS